MRKDTFYRCLKSDKDGHIFAYKTMGFSDGDIGLHKSGNYWCATHIPTGLKLTPEISFNKTKSAALNEAKRIIAEKLDFDTCIQKAINCDAYGAFSQSRYAQECFTVL